jgi:hypothetical protein
MIGSSGGSYGSGDSTAPTGGYAGAADQARNPGELKPKGKNITEGGFDESAPNASFNQDIGGKDDPGRVAEANYQLRDAQPGADAAGGPRQAGVTGQTTYDALNSDEAA